MRALTLVVACVLTVLALDAYAQPMPFALRVVHGGFSEPLFATAPPGDPRLFVVEKTGTIRIVVDGEVLPEPFLDIGDLVSSGSEQGLLGLAFHPQYADNGRFFVNYTDRSGDTQVVGYEVSGNPDRTEQQSAAPVLSIDQPRANHNGGWVGFGPDGYLYVAMGDGGGARDPQGNGQNLQSLLGKILRLDVDSGSPYAIPPDNPFASGGGRPEIFASGVRNPWRLAFDGEDLYVADVGQNRWEEISVISLDDKGANLGWNIMEGSECLGGGTCEQAGLTPPVHTYPQGPGCSVTGGYVYRGAAIPSLQGLYFFSDYCSGTLWSLRYGDGIATELVEYSDLGSVGSVTSFGTDSLGELYVMTQDGDLLQLVPR